MERCCDQYTKTMFKVEHFFVVIFRNWGVFVSRHPAIVILVSLAFGGTMSYFIGNMEEETDTRYLYAAEDTQSWFNYDRYWDSWGNYDDYTRSNTLILSGDGGTSDNLYTTENLEQLLTIHEKILTEVSVTSDGETLYFDDLCAKPYSNNENCDISCVLEFYLFNETSINETITNTNANDRSNININKIVSYPVQFSSWAQEYVTLLTRVASPGTFYYNYTYPGGSIGFDVVNATPAFQCTYTTDADEWGDELLGEWEDAWMELLSEVTDDMGISDSVSVSYNAYKSFEDELTRSIASDVGTFASAFAILCTFATLLVLRFYRREWSLCGLFKCKGVIDASRSRSLVANTGVLAALLAVGTSFGLTGGIIGVKFNGVASVSPFLLLGLGVDDMFVLLRSYELTSPTMSVADRIATTMERGGVSILFTSITDLVAFGIGSTSRFGAIAAFCSFCAVGVLFDFIYCITFFLGFMVYDSRWNSKVDRDSFTWARCLFPCCCGKNVYQDSGDENNGNGNANSNTKDKQIELAASSASTLKNKNKNGDPKSKDARVGSVSMNTVEDSKDSDRHVSPISHLISNDASSQFMERLGEIVLGNRVVSVAILFCFAGYVAGGIYGLTTLISFEDPVDLAPNDSYLREFYSLGEEYFNEIGPALMVGFDKELDYSEFEIQQKISNLTKSIEDDDCFGFPDLTVSWISSYVSYIDENNISISNKSDWYYTLYSDYLNTEEGSIFIDNIWETLIIDFNNNSESVNGLSYLTLYEDVNGTEEITGHRITVNKTEFMNNIDSSIVRSRIWVQFGPIGYGADVLSGCLPFLHKITKEYKSDLGSYYYMEELQYAETNEVAVEQTIINVSLASIAAFLICLILIPFPSVAIYVSYAVAQILVGVVGYMSLWDITINTTSMINIVISVGFSVDNTAHFCHAYMIAPVKKADLEPNKGSRGKSYLDNPSIANFPDKLERHQRCLFALNAVGVPILAGDISTICALLPLAAAQSAIFVSFFKILFLVMLFGAAHAVLFLPILFSVIGPIHIKTAEAEDLDTGVQNAKQTKKDETKKEEVIANNDMNGDNNETNNNNSDSNGGSDNVAGKGESNESDNATAN